MSRANSKPSVLLNHLAVEAVESLSKGHLVDLIASLAIEALGGTPSTLSMEEILAWISAKSAPIGVMRKDAPVNLVAKYRKYMEANDCYLKKIN